MSRAGSGDMVTVKAQNNVYTALVAVACLAQVLAFLVIYLRYKAVFGGDLFGA